MLIGFIIVAVLVWMIVAATLAATGQWRIWFGLVGGYAVVVWLAFQFDVFSLGNEVGDVDAATGAAVWLFGLAIGWLAGICLSALAVLVSRLHQRRHG